MGIWMSLYGRVYKDMDEKIADGYVSVFTLLKLFGFHFFVADGILVKIILNEVALKSNRSMLTYHLMDLER